MSQLVPQSVETFARDAMSKWWRRLAMGVEPPRLNHFTLCARVHLRDEGRRAMCWLEIGEWHISVEMATPSDLEVEAWLKHLDAEIFEAVQVWFDSMADDWRPPTFYRNPLQFCRLDGEGFYG